LPLTGMMNRYDLGRSLPFPNLHFTMMPPLARLWLRWKMDSRQHLMALTLFSPFWPYFCLKYTHLLAFGRLIIKLQKFSPFNQYFFHLVRTRICRKAMPRKLIQVPWLCKGKDKQCYKLYF
jgi:hypothetical protein